MKKIGWIINPIAGLGGPAGMKGSDRAEALAKAERLHVPPVAPERARQVLTRLFPFRDNMALFCAPGPMGEEIARASGFSPLVVGSLPKTVTNARDTQRIAREMAERKVDVLVFVGGDGTARDICSAVGTDLPVLGVPSGVKMHSAVFAIHPAAAARLLQAFLDERPLPTRLQEVMDLDEAAYVGGRVSARLYGYLRVPFVRSYIQSAKAGSRGGENVLPGIAAHIEERMAGEAETMFCLGAGTTVMAVKERLGIAGTLLGVDVVQNGCLLVQDADRPTLDALATQGPVKLVLSPIGGQGFLFGRGNQQFSPELISRCGKDNLIIAAPAEKLAAFAGAPLLVDTGEEAVDRMLYGYIRVITAYHAEAIYRIAPEVFACR